MKLWFPSGPIVWSDMCLDFPDPMRAIKSAFKIPKHRPSPFRFHVPTHRHKYYKMTPWQEMLKKSPRKSHLKLTGTWLNEVDVYNWKGLLVARKMPDGKFKRTMGRYRRTFSDIPKTNQFWRRAFKAGLKNWDYLGPEDRRAWHNFVLHSDTTPRDSFMSQYLTAIKHVWVWPFVPHLEVLMAWDGTIFFHIMTQHPCYMRVHYWVRDDADLYGPLVWWIGSCWKGGLAIPAKTKYSFVNPHVFFDEKEFHWWHFFQFGSWQPGYYPTAFLVTTYDHNLEYCSHSGLYFLADYLDYWYPFDEHKENSGPFDPVESYYYKNPYAYQFPKISEEFK